MDFCEVNDWFGMVGKYMFARSRWIKDWFSLEPHSFAYDKWPEKAEADSSLYGPLWTFVIREWAQPLHLAYKLSMTEKSLNKRVKVNSTKSNVFWANRLSRSKSSFQCLFPKQDVLPMYCKSWLPRKHLTVKFSKLHRILGPLLHILSPFIYITDFLKKILFHFMSMHGFTCIYVCALCVLLMPVEIRRQSHIHWSWSCKCLWTTM